jgi:hypothetical protein
VTSVRAAAIVVTAIATDAVEAGAIFVTATASMGHVRRAATLRLKALIPLKARRIPDEHDASPGASPLLPPA